MCAPCRSRWFYFSELVAVLLLFFIVMLLQRYQQAPPCSLCFLQRLILSALGLCFIMGSIFKLRRCGQLLLNTIILLFSILGAGLASRQIWLHAHPPTVSVITCDANFSYLLQVMSWREFLSHAISGGAGCARNELQLWHLSLGHYSLAGFVCFACLAGWQLLGWLTAPKISPNN